MPRHAKHSACFATSLSECVMENRRRERSSRRLFSPLPRHFSKCYTVLMSDFVHLHVHSQFSLLNAIPTSKELAKAAAADGQTAIAITDNGALYGAIAHVKACLDAGIKPIIGLDAFLAAEKDENLSTRALRIKREIEKKAAVA